MKPRSSNPKLLIVIGLLVLAAAYLLVWRPKSSDLAQAKDQRDQASAQLQSLKAAATAPQTATTTSADTKAIEALVPAVPDAANLFRQLQAIAAATGVDQKTVSPAVTPALAGQDGGSIALTISVSGTKAALYDYLHQLSTLPRLLVVDKVSFQAAAADASGGAQPVTTTGAGATDPAGGLQLDVLARVFTAAALATTGANGG